MLNSVHALQPVRRLDIVTFDEVLRRSSPFGPTRCVIDLRDVQFVTPAGLVCVAALCQAVYDQGYLVGRWPSVELGTEPQRGYLVRAGLIAVLDRIAEINPSVSRLRLMRGARLHGVSTRLIEVTPITEAGILYQLLERVRIFAGKELGYSSRTANQVTQAVSEACSNAERHNGRPCAFFALQEYRQGIESWVEIGIADCGDGLAATLARNSRHGVIDSDTQAIELAIRERTSQFDDETCGTGLQHLLRIVGQLEGTVYLRSGTARACFDRAAPNGRYTTAPHMPGVQIALMLRGR